MTALRRAQPLELLVTVASLALTAYAFSKLLGGVAPLNVLVWFVGAIIAHDLVAYPMYTALDRVALGGGSSRRRHGDSPQRGGGGRNYVRVPAALSALALLVYAPNILDLSGGRYERSTGLSADVFLGRWLLIVAGLFLASAVVWAVRRRRAGRGEGVSET